MKTSLGLCLFLGAVAPMFAAVGVGDSYDQVIADKGAPSGKLSAEVQAQNANLARRFRIGGYPTVVVLNSVGKPIGGTSYMEGGPVPFIGKIDQF